MGAKHSCFSNHRGSLSQQPHQPAPVRVVAADGSLKELHASPRVTVSDVLGGSAASFFVCNSDALYFEKSPPALASGEVLRPGHIYFVLPAALLGRPLSSADMASLAVRASSAIAAKKPQRRRWRRSGGRKKVRVMPVCEEVEDGEDVLLNEKLNERTLGEFAVSPKSQEKMAAVAARSRLKVKLMLKRALSIIQEVAE
ncbi:hypothetical protein CFC21_083094 [Triticum aestivum]|uniref:Uncharacterized protein n=3 Tax=Triticum TaxID=4564 RepID=A0A9R0XY01_TRITD|nr:uncharacterized protein LOC123130529 [Triticum aestivum]KAF7078707.1 hypothetical protein CFC21_083094 [Triticum aestivum]VAI45078.1 unnamed protein product [Triticum turgidum subsp. durum]